MGPSTGMLERSLEASGGGSGSIIDGTHHFSVRVYFEDTDTGGIVYHANYLKYMERARTEILRLCGLEQSASTIEQGVGYAVRSCNVEFLMPAVLDDVLEVRSTLRKIGGAYLDAEQNVWRGGEQLTKGKVRAVCIGNSGAPRRHPREVVEKMATILPITSDKTLKTEN